MKNFYHNEEDEVSIKVPILISVFFSIVLFLFLWLRPAISGFGEPVAPNVSGRPAYDLEIDIQAAAPSPEASPKIISKENISHSDTIESDILKLINEERTKNDLKPLASESNLGTTARSHSDDMIARNFFDHVNPDALSPAQRIAIENRRLIGTTGENIWKGTGCVSGSGCDPAKPDVLAQKIVNDWMHSPGHRANILRKDFTHLGVGVSMRDGSVMATQNFSKIMAYLEKPLPESVKTGTALDLATTSLAEGYQVKDFDLWASDLGIRVGDIKPVTDSQIQANAGTYKLRFYFPKNGGYEIFDGPQIRVEKP